VRLLPRLRRRASTARGGARRRPGRPPRRRAALRRLDAPGPRGEADMIITRSPLRVSLGGGGTDLPSYYRRHGGFLMAAAIDKYIYITVHRRFVDGFLLKYSHLEEVSSIDEIEHPIIREALKLAGVSERNLEIASMADIPAGT